jgi:hypothetical protein
MRFICDSTRSPISALVPIRTPSTTAWIGDCPDTAETPISITAIEPITPAIAPSTVLCGLMLLKNGWRPMRLPTSSAAASLTTTAKIVNRVQTRPFGFDV